MRCNAIAQEVERLGGSVLFAVSSEESVENLASIGRAGFVLPADCMHLEVDEGSALGDLCLEAHARSVLVDTYGITDGFFHGLQCSCGHDVPVTWIDDLYTYELGECAKPVRRDVDQVIDYSFGVSTSDYEAVYANEETKLCIAPAFAPVRPQFCSDESRGHDAIKRVLITTGSTNEGSLLERAALVCLKAIPDAQVDVVVGALASFDRPSNERVVVHQGLTDLSFLMREADLCISAAGTTLYELSAIGVPTVAIPMVENQIPNAKGFERLGLGLVVQEDDGLPQELFTALKWYEADSRRRRECVSRMHDTVDCQGSLRIAKVLYG